MKNIIMMMIRSDHCFIQKILVTDKSYKPQGSDDYHKYIIIKLFCTSLLDY